MELLFLFLLLLSAFFSGAETAFLQSQKAKAFVWNRQGKLFSKQLLRYIHEPEKYLITVLVGNNLVNIAYTSVGTILLISYFSEEEIVLILVLIVLFFSEITPKISTSILADWLILKLTPLIVFFEILLYPLTLIASFFSKALLRNKKETQLSEYFSENEIDHIFAESKELEIEEHQYIKNIFLLNQTKVKEVMTARTDIIGIEKNMPIAEVIRFFAAGSYSKLPVYEESMDQIVAFVFAIDLLHDVKKLSDIMRPVLFVPETKSCKTLLLELKKERKTTAIAIDEFGGVSGLVSMEDILEVIVGRIKDEVDNVLNNQELIRINKSRYKISGQVEKEKLAEITTKELPKGDYETVAGLILNQLERLPKRDETVEFDGFSLKVINMKQNRIEWILLKLDYEH